MSKIVIPEVKPFITPFAQTIVNQKYAHNLPDGSLENYSQIAYRVVSNVMQASRQIESYNPKYKALFDSVEQQMVNSHASREFIPGGRYLASAGMGLHQCQNCLLMICEDSREGWAEMFYNVTMGTMTGAGIGVDYSKLREKGRSISRTRGTSSGPIPAMVAVNELGRASIQGGDRRGALWAGLNWLHKDIFQFIQIKNWSPAMRKVKEEDFNFSLPMDMTNVSVLLDDLFFKAYNQKSHKYHDHAHKVYWDVVKAACKTGEPGFSIDVGENAGETARNGCCEITSSDDSDICNLGSINLAEVTSSSKFTEVMPLSIGFLLAGTLYSDVPYEKVDTIRTKNRRLGLGLMGIHEFLLMHGHKYGSLDCDEFNSILETYKTSTDYAKKLASDWGITLPVKTRGIAPTGSIALVGETTNGIEPIFCAARKRRFFKDEKWVHQYVVDPTVEKVLKAGVDKALIEDAYTLSYTLEGIERRIAFQAHVQQFVDHAISSTLNLDKWGSETNNEGTLKQFGDIVMKYLPKLRGLTVYPSEGRAGQPITPVKIETAMKHLGQTFTEGGEVVVSEGFDVCSLTGGGSCGA